MTRATGTDLAQRKARAAAYSAPGDKLAYSVPEAAHALGVGTTTMWEMLRAGSVRKFRIGSRVLIKREELQRVISEAEAQEAT